MPMMHHMFPGSSPKMQALYNIKAICEHSHTLVTNPFDLQSKLDGADILWVDFERYPLEVNFASTPGVRYNVLNSSFVYFNDNGNHYL